jgi:hypothetical protein
VKGGVGKNPYKQKRSVKNPNSQKAAEKVLQHYKNIVTK